MLLKKPQILYIHGGFTFKSKSDYIKYLKNSEVKLTPSIRWHGDYLDKQLGREFEIIRPRMPFVENAKYDLWKLNFEKYFTYLRNNLILVGGSLGGIFLARYLSENKFPKKILSVYLVCPPFDNSVSQEDLVGGFKLKSDLSLIEKNCHNVHLLFSSDDDIVPVYHAAKYAKKLTNSHIVIYDHIPGHFKISKFPEIIKMIKNDLKNIKKTRR